MSTNRVNAILILQGGGALGAYECGAFKVIAPRLDDKEKMQVVAGTSIGAVNACIIASAYQKEKLEEKPVEKVADDLKKFWIEELPNPSLRTFLPSPNMQFPFVEAWLRYLDIWTSALWGNQHIFTPDPLNTTNPFATHHYDMHALESTIREHFSTCTGYEYYKKGNTPRLIVAAVDVQQGHMKTFDSDKEDITPEKVVACCSIAPFMPAKKVGSSYYWDGGLWNNTPLGEVLNALQKPTVEKGQSSSKARNENVPEYKVYLVNDHPHQGSLPQDLIGVQERVLDIMLADKSDNDIKTSEWLNRYIRLVQHLHKWANESPSKVPEDVKEEIDNAYDQITEKKRAILHFVHLRREGLPYDYWSATGDFSLGRIKELIAQGERETQQQLKDHDVLKKVPLLH
jgi:NTE family protein